jgi:trehalose utilization protein
MFEIDPEKRISLEDVLNSEWMTKDEFKIPDPVEEVVKNWFDSTKKVK